MRPPRHGGGSTAIGAIPRHRRRAQRAFVGGEALLRGGRITPTAAAPSGRSRKATTAPSCRRLPC
eukprot:4765211-Pyramimonas_sp.AAC.1